MDVEIFNGEYYIVFFDGSLIIAKDKHKNISKTKVNKPTSYVFINNNNFIVGTDNGSVYLFNIDNYSKTLLFNTSNIIKSLYFSTTDTLLYAGSEDSFLYIWNLNTNRMFKKLRFGNPIEAVEINKSGNIFIVGSDSVYLLNKTHKTIATTLSDDPCFINSSTLSNELFLGAQRHLIICQEDTIYKVNIPDNNETSKRIVEIFKLSQNNHDVYYYATLDGEIWEYSNDSFTLKFDFNLNIYQFHYSPLDSSFYIVLGRNNEVYKWQPLRGIPIIAFRANHLSEDQTWCIAEDTKGNKLITSGHDVLVYDKNMEYIRNRFVTNGLMCLATDNRKTARFVGDSLVFAISYDGSILFRNYLKNNDIINKIEKKAIEKRFNMVFDSAVKKDLYFRLWKDSNNIQYLDLDNNNWIVYDKHGRFDGSNEAINTLYLTCGLEIIKLSQIKDSLWVPGLADKILKGEEILINDKPAAKLNNLNICEYTPIIDQPQMKGSKWRFRIVPRRGGLNTTEVIINGNPTYSYTTEQLDYGLENGKGVYYLNLNIDTIQDYLLGNDLATNCIQVKTNVKESGICGRGEIIELTKSSNKIEHPKFFGVFIGVNEYGYTQGTSDNNKYRNLSYAVKDADDLANAIHKCTKTIFDDSTFIYRLTGIDSLAPTKENMQRVLKEISKKARSTDVLYIFFAGHGDLKEIEGGKQIRFILKNGEKSGLKRGSFGSDELRDWCHPRKIKAQKRVFVFDACHSGHFMNETYSAVHGRGSDDEGKRIRQLDKLRDKNGMIILAASAENESAYEDETLNQGVLTYHLLQAIKTQTKDTTLTVKDWFEETIELVADYSRQNGQEQKPQYFGDGLFEIGNTNKEVRDAIKIECPKKRIGNCVFSSNAKTRQAFPSVEKQINDYFLSASQNQRLVYSQKSNKAYKAVGYYILDKKVVEVNYDIYIGENIVKSNIMLPRKKYQNEQELVKTITNSLEKEIELLNAIWRRQNCQLSN
jgi:WD40 repeat protein